MTVGILVQNSSFYEIDLSLDQIDIVKIKADAYEECPRCFSERDIYGINYEYLICPNDHIMNRLL